ncbi:MAG: RNA polymerase sigma factor [Planctomycetota bacterium]|nr:RNA polymerase sigma factor [Planctomycetota bacterium]
MPTTLRRRKQSRLMTQETPQILDDSTLLARYLERRDQDAFRQLVDRHAPMVYVTCHRMLRDEHAAEDAAQAVFLLLVRRTKDLKGHINLGGWLHRTAVLTSKESIRQGRTRKCHEREAGNMRLHASMDESAHPVWNSVSDRLDALLHALPSEQREAIVQRFLLGRSEAEAARELKVPVGTLSARVARALGRLREKLGGHVATLAVPALAKLLAEHAAEPAPATLTQTIHAACLGQAAASTGAVYLLEATMRTLIWMQVKSMALICAAVLVLAVAAPVTYRVLAGEAVPPVAVEPPQPGPPPQPALPVVPARVTFEPKPTEQALYYERVAHTKFEVDDKALELVKSFFIPEFVDCQILKLDAVKQQAGMKLSFQAEKVYSSATGAALAQAQSGLEPKTVYFFTAYSKNGKEAPLQVDLDLLPGPKVVSAMPEFDFAPVGNAFAGMGFAALEFGLSIPLAHTCGAARAKGDTWSLPVQFGKDDSAKLPQRKFMLAGLARVEGRLVARLEEPEQPLQIEQPKLLDGTIDILGSQFPYVLGVKLDGKRQATSHVDVERAVVLDSEEHWAITLEITLTPKGEMPPQIRTFVGTGMNGKCDIRIRDRLIDAAQANALNGKPAPAVAVAAAKARWEAFSKDHKDALDRKLAEGLLDLLKKAPEAAKTAEEF